MAISVGEPAPEIALPGTDGTDLGRRRYTLSEFSGMPVVLAFYPADQTPVCTAQLTAYTNEIGQFRDVGAQVLAISPQSIERHERFAAENGGFAFPLLADIDHRAGDEYGVPGPMGFYRRSVFVIDETGVVRWLHRSTAGLRFRPTDEIVAAVRSTREIA